jgi:hypothetical protein
LAMSILMSRMRFGRLRMLKCVVNLRKRVLER